MDLERELRALDVEWPQTPELRLVLGEQQPRRRSRRALLVAIAVGLVALAVSFAVPQSRGAILRFLHLGGETIEFVDTLPPAQDRALDAQFGIDVTLAQARVLVANLLLPQLEPPPRLHSAGKVVSLVFVHDGRQVLLSELESGDEMGFLKKLASGETNVEWVEVQPNRYGVWISGAPHVFFFPRTPPRLAGNTLVWVQNGTTYRLEGPHLSRDAAIALARSLRFPG